MERLDSKGAVMTKAVKEIIDSYADSNGLQILFERLNEKEGITFVNDAGALIVQERKFVSGGYERQCSYPFLVIYRTEAPDELSRLRVNDLLNRLGDYLAGLENISADGLTITGFQRMNVYADTPSGNRQDWFLPVTAFYTYGKKGWFK